MEEWNAFNEEWDIEKLELLLKNIANRKSQIRRTSQRKVGRKNLGDFETKWSDDYEDFGEPVTMGAVQKWIQRIKRVVSGSRRKTDKDEYIEHDVHRLYDFLAAGDKYVKDHKVSNGENPDDVRSAWYIYFHRKMPGIKPNLGRAILTIISDTECRLNNLTGDGRANFEGAYFKTGAGNYDFNLRQKKKRGDSLFMKISRAETTNDEVLLGGFLSYEHGQVVVGSLAVCRMSPKDEAKLGNLDASETENLKARAFSHRDSEWEDIDESIRGFLSMRVHSYLTIPPDVNSFDKLKTYNHGSLTKQSRRSRFFQVGKKPIVFIAANSTFYEKHQSILESTKEYLSKGLKIPPKNIQEIGHKDEEESTPENSGELIKRATLFLCFISRGDTKLNQEQSFATAQLGQAINQSKSVILFFEKEAISSKLYHHGKVSQNRFDDFVNEPAGVEELEAATDENHLDSLFDHMKAWDEQYEEITTKIRDKLIAIEGKR